MHFIAQFYFLKLFDKDEKFSVETCIHPCSLFFISTPCLDLTTYKLELIHLLQIQQNGRKNSHSGLSV